MQHILIIDDEVEVTHVYKSYLEGSKYITHITNSPQEAWRKLEHEKFDLIITDLQMPHIDGDEFISIVRKNETHSRVPIIIASGCSNKLHDKQAERNHNLFLIKKPFSKDSFLGLISQVI